MQQQVTWNRVEHKSRAVTDVLFPLVILYATKITGMITKGIGHGLVLDMSADHVMRLYA